MHRGKNAEVDCFTVLVREAVQNTDMEPQKCKGAVLCMCPFNVTVFGAVSLTNMRYPQFGKRACLELSLSFSEENGRVFLLIGLLVHLSKHRYIF